MRIIDIDAELRLSERAARFEGARHGDGIAVSSFITQYHRGQGPDQHLHPYAEMFIVQEGVAEFRVDGQRTEVAAGHVVVVPPNTPHGFKNPGDALLRVVSVHPSPEVVQTDLE